jgi:membrane protease YdiL (CAAX protease family)
MNLKFFDYKQVTAWILLILYILAIGSIIPLLAPLLHALWPEGMPLSRCVHRGLQLAAIALALPYLIRNWRSVGMGWNREALSRFGHGVAALAPAMVLIPAIMLACGVREWAGLPQWPTVLGWAATALSVAIVEEILFRGFVQRALVERAGAIAGLALTALFFAGVHFIRVPEQIAPAPVTLATTMEGLFAALREITVVSNWLDRGPVLVLLGLNLGLLYQRSNSLWTAIGAHFSIVLTLKFILKSTNPTGISSAFSPDPAASGLTALMLLLVLIGLWHLNPVHRPGLGGMRCST